MENSWFRIATDCVGHGSDRGFLKRIMIGSFVSSRIRRVILGEYSKISNISLILSNHRDISRLIIGSIEMPRHSLNSLP